MTIACWLEAPASIITLQSNRRELEHKFIVIAVIILLSLIVMIINLLKVMQSTSWCEIFHYKVCG